MSRDGHGKARPRRRGRLPTNAVLILADDLPANRNHPLATTDPDIRAARRLRLIATVLARLARGQPRCSADQVE